MTYSYDEEGNREFRFVDADSSGTITTGDTEITEYAWDHRNRLVGVTYYDDYEDYYSGTSDWSVENKYDYLNRWIYRKLDPDGTGGSADVLLRR